MSDLTHLSDIYNYDYYEAGGRVVPNSPYYSPDIWWFNISERIVVIEQK